jgi:hypothetical protein
MTELTKSIKRLIDLIYVFAAFWGFGQFIEWIMIFGG